MKLRYTFYAFILLLGACGTPTLAPVVEKEVLTNKQEVEPMGGELIRIIQPGDTLYSIAFALGLDVNDLAAWNGLSDKSRILAGQRLRLTRPIGFDQHAVKSKASQGSIAVKTNQKSPPQTSNKAKAEKQPSSSKRLSNAAMNWAWPMQGRVIASFKPSAGKQGIDIRGQQDQSVFSAAAGEVVYVGNGLKGYGNLIIVKHSAHYLSAYAHNDKVFVTEGEKITARKKIATVGQNGNSGHVLHFQIRRDGKPVNPIDYLPKKS